MSNSTTPRSVADATRFTSTTPHVNSKPPAAASGSANTTSASSTSASSSSSTSQSASRPPPRRPGPPTPSRPAAPAGGSSAGGSGITGGETPEERVRRLRAAHLAARNADTSRFDRVVAFSRRWMDSAHRITVLGLIGFSGIALLATAYATVDMARYNRQRRTEFAEMQKRVAADSLEAARLAYIADKATEEQIAIVEDAEARARAGGFKLPPLLSSPRGLVNTEEGARPAGETAGRSLGVGESISEANLDAAKEKSGGGITGWLFGGLKAEDKSGAASSNGSLQHDFKDRAKAAFEKEKELHRQGGPLDQVGSVPAPAVAATQPEKKKGWLW